MSSIVANAGADTPDTMSIPHTINSLAPAITLRNESIPERNKDYVHMDECEHGEHKRTNTLRRMAIPAIKMEDVVHKDCSAKLTPFNGSPYGNGDGGITDESTGMATTAGDQDDCDQDLIQLQVHKEAHGHKRINIELDLGLNTDVNDAKDPEIDD